MTLPVSAPATARRASAAHLRHSHVSNLRLLGLLRDIRTDAEHIRRQLPVIEAAIRVEDARAREAAVTAAVTRLRALLDEDGRAIESWIAEARSMLETNEVLYDFYGDSITEIENDWRDFLALVPGVPAAAESIDPAAVLPLVKDGPASLDGLAYGVGLVTVAPRLNAQLQGVRIGGSLDFHAAFEDEIANTTDRLRVFSWLASQPSGIDGVIDLAEGRVYRASQRQSRRIASYVGLVMLAAIGGLLFCFGLANVGAWFGLTAWPIQPGRFPEFLGAYLMLVFGAGAHILIDAIKQARGASSRASFLAIGDWLLWITSASCPLRRGSSRSGSAWLVWRWSSRRSLLSRPSLPVTASTVSSTSS